MVNKTRIKDQLCFAFLLLCCSFPFLFLNTHAHTQKEKKNNSRGGSSNRSPRSLLFYLHCFLAVTNAQHMDSRIAGRRTPFQVRLSVYHSLLAIHEETPPGVLRCRARTSGGNGNRKQTNTHTHIYSDNNNKKEPKTELKSELQP
jgi:hypothetical protein